MLAVLLAVCASIAAFTLCYYVVARIRSGYALVQAGGSDRRDRNNPRRSPLIEAWIRRVAPVVPSSFAGRMERLIERAGGLEGLSPAELMLYALVAGLSATAFGVWIAVATGWTLWTVVAFTVFGALYPFQWLRDQVKKRHQAILADMPYQLDLLTLSVEAGLDFGAAVAKVVERGRAGPLREELARMLGEVRVGKTRAEAMEAVSERVGLTQLSSFLSAMIQADRLGSGVGATLRLQADQLRTERFQRAEKLAGEAPVKMLIPLVIFIFPTIWIILAAPLVFQWLFQS